MTQEQQYLFLLNLFSKILCFGCTGSSLLMRAFPVVSGKQGVPYCTAGASSRGGFSCCEAQALESVGSVTGMPGLAALRHGIFPDPGMEPMSLYWQVDS